MSPEDSVPATAPAPMITGSPDLPVQTELIQTEHSAAEESPAEGTQPR